MRRIVLWLIPLLLLAPSVRAEDDPKEQTKSEQASAAAKAIKELEAGLKETEAAARKAFQEAKTPEAQRKVQDEFRAKLRNEFADKYLAVAEKYPKDPEALQALQLVFSVGRDEQVEKAVALILKNAPDSEQAVELAQALAQRGSSAGEKLIRGLLAKNTNHAAQARLTLALGQLFKSQSESADLSLADAATLNEKAEKTFTQVMDEFKDVKDAAAQAKGSLFEVRTLGIGKTAPEITGEDGDSKKFKLSDYRGKVVVLDFWASW
jgi:AhpC/TSA family